jgi:adenine phosphoribosyltransferase
MDGVEALKRSLERSDIIRIGDYHYFVHPISDGIPALDPAFLDLLARDVAAMVDPGCDRILTVEALGIPIATATALRMGKPLTIVRKKRYGLPGEVAVPSSTGYATHTLYLNGIRKGEKVAFIDDVLSTGGTMRAVVGAVRKAGAEVCDALVVIEKGSNRERVERELGIKVKSLVKVEIRKGKVVVI